MGDRTERLRDGHISSTGPHWGPLGSKVGINPLRRWTPTLGINRNKKITKVPQMTRWIDGHILLPLNGFCPITCDHMFCAQLLAALMTKKGAWTTIQRYRHTYINTYIQTYKLNSTPLGSSSTQCTDKCITALDPHIGKYYKYQNRKSPMGDWTEERIDG